MAGADVLKTIASKAIDRLSEQLNIISQDIWKNPELGYKEYSAHNLLTEFLEKVGFSTVERSYVVETGFRAEYGDEGKPNVAVLCEYDALPEIGHACGHNLIAEVGIGASIGIKHALEASRKNGKALGKLTVLGTPAEEGYGGKVDFLHKNAFDGIDAALMAHPWPSNFVTADGFLARARLGVKYFGKASHAAGFPWEGVNALDAAVMAYNSISVMRQQCKPSWRIHGVISNGGVKPNIIPEETELDYYIRAPTIKELDQLKLKAVACFEGAAKATGCKVELVWHEKPFANVLTNPTLGKLYEVNASALGLKFSESGNLPTGSTDMGNVSHVVPSIHPFFYIGTDAPVHTRVFTAATGDAKAQPYAITQAKLLAMVAIDVYCQPELLASTKLQLAEQLQGQA